MIEPSQQGAPADEFTPVTVAMEPTLWLTRTSSHILWRVAGRVVSKLLIGAKVNRLMLVSALTLSSCAHQQPTAPPPNPTVACFADLHASPAFQPLAGRIRFGGRSNVEMVSDTSHATPQQQEAIKAAEIRYGECVSLGTAWRQRYVPPAIDSVGMRFSRETQAALALLYRGEITFGQYNTHNNALRADLEQRINEIREAMRKEQAELQRSEAIARIMAPPPPPLPQVTFTPLRPLPPPTTTTCQRIGDQLTCTTR